MDRSVSSVRDRLEISDSRLEELLPRIKPVVRNKNDKLCYIKKVGPRNTAFTWSPKIIRRALGLVPYKTITTYHTYGYHGIFKPSIAEVIAQIPVEDINKVIAFETKIKGDGDPAICIDFSESCHIADTILYRRMEFGKILGCFKAVKRNDK